jgi:hypothetical protein
MGHKMIVLVMMAGVIGGSVISVGASTSRVLDDLRAKEQVLVKRHAECLQLQKTIDTNRSQGPGAGTSAGVGDPSQKQDLRCDEFLKNLAVNRQMQERVLNQR